MRPGSSRRNLILAIASLALLLPFAANATRPPAASLPASPASATGAKLTFRRVFKSSSPEFIEISVQQNADQGTYEIRQLEEDPEKLPFEVGEALRAKMFELAGQLNNFQGQDLDVHRKIANLGEKTFRWEQGGKSYEATFNYTLNASASQLLQIFEGLARQQELLMLLERRMKYDRLGINDALLQFETELNRKLLPEPQRALTTLDQIAADSRFVEIGRQRARTLAERIRHPS
jgi:TolA-binding protein